MLHNTNPSGLRVMLWFPALLDEWADYNTSLKVLEQTQPLSGEWSSVYKDINPTWIPAIDGHLSPCWPASAATYSTFLLWCVYRELPSLHALLSLLTQRQALMELMWLSPERGDGFLHILESISHPFLLFSFSPSWGCLMSRRSASLWRSLITIWKG